MAIRGISLEAEALQRIAEREVLDLCKDSVMISKDAISEEIDQIKRNDFNLKPQRRGVC